MEAAKDATRRRRRVLLFTNSVMMGGMERHVELLVRHLDRSQFEVFTACPDWPATREFDRTLRCISDHHVVCTPDRRWGALRELSEAWRLLRQLRAWRIDALHMHLTTFKGGWWILLVSRLARVPTVLCTEHLAPDTPVGPVQWLTRALFVQLLNRLICVSAKNLLMRKEHLFTPAGRTTVVVNGVDPADFPPCDPALLTQLRRSLGLPVVAPIVGTVVRLASDKGLNYLLEAMPHVLKHVPDAYLVLVGDGPLRAELAALARQLDVDTRVVFAGFHTEPRPFLALMDVFVLPVPVGSMSIGLLEAMAMRRAVVITFGGPGEAVVDKESGLWAPPRDPKALSEAIVTILRNPCLARQYGEAARRKVEDDFSAPIVARRLGALYSCARTPDDRS